MGPRAVRDASTDVRNINRASGINPFTLCNCADLGDSPVNPLDLMDSLNRITEYYKQVVEDKDIHPLSVGGDHLVSLPVLRGIAPKYSKPLGLIHFDAHSDTWDTYFGDDNKYSHGTGFRRAIEEGLIDPTKTIQIGLRGALYGDALDDWYGVLPDIMHTV
jgi:guanidinopropionase